MSTRNRFEVPDLPRTKVGKQITLANTLRTEIMQGKLPPGTQLPPPYCLFFDGSVRWVPNRGLFGFSGDQASTFIGTGYLWSFRQDTLP